jgi:hypothetical protein
VLVELLARFNFGVFYYSELSERFGSHSRIERLATRLLSQEGLAAKRNKRREDILTYIAMMRFQGLKAVPFRASHKWKP